MWAADESPVEVLVYGATPGGIAAALAAAEDGCSVRLIEPTPYVGGLVTSGLSHTDFRTLEGLTGAYLDFAQRVEAHYREKYGPDSPQVRDAFHGTFGEPHVNTLVFEALLAEQPRIRVERSRRLVSIVVSGSGNRRAIRSARFAAADGVECDYSARVCIDGTYEGDLMAAAGVEFRIGREGQGEYGESLAPPEADEQLQAYNFRLTMTRDPANRVTPVAPPGYRREDFLDVLPFLASGQIRRIFDYPKDCIFKAQTPALPNSKYDINDVSRGMIRLSLPGRNLDWPNGDAATRERVFADHLRDQTGLLYFLQNDAAVPEKFRGEARDWGWCRDEFADSGHLPPQLYVREARRMIGQHVFIQQDSQCAPGDARAVFHADAVAMGDYGNNCHGTAHKGPRFGGQHTGEFYHAVPPYQIPFGVLLPKDVTNLLVPVAASSSHVGFCALRLEPIWMSLGQAAGHAAALAVERQGSVELVPLPVLQSRLHAAGAATIYVSDVLPEHEDFAAVQWWGQQGGMHGLDPTPAAAEQRGKNIASQYYEAFRGHAVRLDAPLTAEVERRWRTIALRLRIASTALPQADGMSTRGDFIRRAYGENPR